jgi:serine protease Do
MLRKLAGAVSCALFAVLAGGFLLKPAAQAEHLWAEIPVSQVKRAETLPDFSDLAAKLSPAVVNISTEQSEEETSGTGDPGSEGSPFERFNPHSRSLGSGFIINKDGYILTNEHVIENATTVTVSTRDGHEYKAKVVGRDAKTDIALIKINPRHDLPVAPLGNSDDVRVGEWVMAIGNPFGFDHTVTAGIVSAMGRFIPGNYDDFIQTDASINPGNSGGPLINLRGEVVGVNSAIYTRTGLNSGIGFAVPINLVKQELDQLKTRGKVVRGWLGVYVQKVTPELAESLGLSEAKGALVADLVKNGPAKAAGLQRGDVIVAYDNQPVTDSQELPLLVGRTPLGRTAVVKIIRKGKPREVNVMITASQEQEIASAQKEGGGSAEGGSLGLYVKNLDAQLAKQLGIDAKTGVVISSVRPGSPADQAGLRPRDVILEVNREPVKDTSAYRQALKTGQGKILLLLVKREDTTMFVPVKPQG